MHKTLMMVLLSFSISTSVLADDKKLEISEYQQKKLDQRVCFKTPHKRLSAS